MYCLTYYILRFVLIVHTSTIGQPLANRATALLMKKKNEKKLASRQVFLNGSMNRKPARYVRVSSFYARLTGHSAICPIGYDPGGDISTFYIDWSDIRAGHYVIYPIGYDTWGGGI